MATRFMTAILALFLSGGAQALPWDKDMVDQPSEKATESKVASPDNSVPVGGGEVGHAPADALSLIAERTAFGQTMENPVRVTGEGLLEGQRLYEIHCLPCHGETGVGNGLAGENFVPLPLDLTIDYVQSQPDGQIFYTLTYGSVAMPWYRDSLTQVQRWQVIHYVKEVLGRDE